MWLMLLFFLLSDKSMIILCGCSQFINRLTLENKSFLETYIPLYAGAFPGL